MPAEAASVKAAVVMREGGVEYVALAEEGILKYFEETDGQGYRGSCYVFGVRRAMGSTPN